MIARIKRWKPETLRWEPTGDRFFAHGKILDHMALERSFGCDFSTWNQPLIGCHSEKTERRKDLLEINEIIINSHPGFLAILALCSGLENKAWRTQRLRGCLKSLGFLVVSPTTVSGKINPLKFQCLKTSWLVVWNMNLIFPFSWEFHHSNWLSLHHFSEGFFNHQPD